jgi:hypothetical protein
MSCVPAYDALICRFIGLEGKLDPALTAMVTKIPWGTLETTGDQSEYVTMSCNLVRLRCWRRYFAVAYELVNSYPKLSFCTTSCSRRSTLDSSATSSSRTRLRFFAWSTRYVDLRHSSFCPQLKANIYNCKRLSDEGAEQLLLGMTYLLEPCGILTILSDMSVLKTFLLDLPVLPSNLAAANSLLPVQPRVASKQVRTLVISFSHLLNVSQY